MEASGKPAVGLGQIEGKVSNVDGGGDGVGGVTIAVENLGHITLSDNNGYYQFQEIPSANIH